MNDIEYRSKYTERDCCECKTYFNYLIKINEINKIKIKLKCCRILL